MNFKKIADTSFKFSCRLFSTTENKEVSSANNLILDDDLTAKSSMYIQKIAVLELNLVGLQR